jgi:hypothetical protein
MKLYFKFEFEEQNDERDTIQELNISFEDTKLNDETLKKRLNTFLIAIGSSLKVQ